MRVARSVAMALVGGLLGVGAAAGEGGSFDLLIRQGRVLDGTGNPWALADVAVDAGRIVAVGDLSGARAARVIDAAGLYVAPGFIDVHTHAARGLGQPELRFARPLLAQGITTALLNPDGGGPTDLVQQRADLSTPGVGVNVGLMVPHGSVRRAVMGMEDRPPTPDEAERMGQLVRAGMEAGAFGLSSGLYYTPGSFATTEEVIALARQIAPHGGIYASHIRDEGDFGVGLVAAVDELIRVAREARVRGVVTHIKALGRGVWGLSAAVVRRIEEARAEGVEVFADQYPYEASATSLIGALVPAWAQAGGRDDLHGRIRDGQVRERLAAEVGQNIERRGGAGALVFRRHEEDPSIEGKALEAVATERNLGAVELALALILEGNPGVVSFNMDEGDVRRFMAQPWVMTSTDGELVPMGEGVPHPRSYGAFPRKIHAWVLEKEVIDLAFAVRSMTSLSATVFRIPDRGWIRPGAHADILVFDLAALEDTATYTRPHQLAAGMRHVLVNGEPAIDDGRFTDGLHGRVLSPRLVTSREP